MKLNDVKHNHSLTDLLKVLLFSIIMLLPFIDVAVRCGYVMLNKNAYESYSDVATSTTSKLNDGDTLYDGLMYQFAYSSGTTTTGNTRFDVKNGETNVVDLYFTGETWTTQYIQFYSEHGNTRLIVYDTNNTSHNKIDWQDVSNTFYLVMEGDKTLPTGTQYFNCYQVSYTYDKLDNVFEYSVSKLEQSQLYNWTTQTAIYSGVSQMTSQLGITTNIIPIIVCYWFFITIIYIILDIVIRLFTMLTHTIGSKTSS